MKRRILAAAFAVVMAVAGTLVLIAYVKKASAQPAPGAAVDTVPVLVAAAPIAAGTPAAELAGLVRTTSLPAAAVLPDRVANLTQLAGQVALIPLSAGEQLLVDKFGATPATGPSGASSVPVPPGLQQVSVLLRPEQALGGALRGGDTVGVFISLNKPEPGLTHLTLQKVLITAVTPFRAEPTQAAAPPTTGSPEAGSTPTPAGGALGKAVGGGAPAGGTAVPGTSDASTDPTVSVLVTLATTAAGAERIVYGAEHGSLWLSDEPLTADEGGTDVVDGSKVYR